MGILGSLRGFWGRLLGRKYLGNPNWQTRGVVRGFYDSYRTQAEPTVADLLAGFEDTAFACAKLISSNLASVPLRLYATTRQGERRPKCATRPVKNKNWERLNRKSHLVSKALHLDEVVDHPLLHLLHNPNDYFGLYGLLELTDLYQETSGSTFWWLDKDTYGLPERIFVLPSHLVRIDRNDAGEVVGYEYGSGLQSKYYSPEDVLHFSFLNLFDPYHSGYSPLRAAWERVAIIKKELAYLGSVLDNQGKPSAIISPADANAPIGPAEGEKLARDFSQRFRESGSGGVFVNTDASLKLDTLSWPPNQVLDVELMKYVRLIVCNCFGVPISLLDTEASNRSVSEAGLFQLANVALNPRIRHLEESLNHKLVGLYDERLILAFDDSVIPDPVAESQKRLSYVSGGIMTRNEARLLEGLDEEPWGEAPILPPGTALPPEVSADDNETAGLMGAVGGQPGLADQETQTGPAGAAALRATVQGSQAVADLQRSYYAGEIAREACIANAIIVFAFKPDEAAALFPEIAPTKLTPPDQPPAAAPSTNEPQPAAAETAPDQQQPDATADTPQPEQDDGQGEPDLKQIGEQWMQELLDEWQQEQPSEKCGGEGGPPGPGHGPGGPQPASGGAATSHEAAHTEAASKAQKIVTLAKELPAKVWTAAKQKVATKYKQLENRYGRAAAVTILAFGLIGTATPVPGGGLLLAAPAIAVSEAYIRLTGQVPGAAKTADFNDFDVSPTTKALRQVDHTRLEKVLRDYFRRQGKVVTSRLKSLRKKAPFFSPEEWDRQLYDAVRPVIELTWQDGVDTITGQLGLSPKDFAVTTPRLREAIDKWTLKFCEATNRTTSLELDQAHAKLKEELGEGVTAGETLDELKQRVQAVYERASNDRAFAIAVTESTRAIHGAEMLVARDSGLVKSKRWLLSADPCPQCQAIAARGERPLEEPYFEDDYGDGLQPPAHVGCLCSQTYQTK